MRLIDADDLKEHISELLLVYSGKEILDAIDNAPTVEERPQGDLADEVWKLYKKHQSHLATHVIEFGDELKELLDKHQKGGAE